MKIDLSKLGVSPDRCKITSCYSTEKEADDNMINVTIMESAPEMLETLIDILTNEKTKMSPRLIHETFTVIEKATGKSWGTIKELLNA